jgi:hypothetical protein
VDMVVHRFNDRIREGLARIMTVGSPDESKPRLVAAP